MKTINKSRVLAIDLARGVSVILMVLVHCMLVYGNDSTRDHSIFGWIVNIMGQGAPMFLVSMGISFFFSKNRHLSTIFLRAVIILAAGYFMNFLKFIIPILLLGGLPDSFISAYGMQQGDPSNMIFFILLGDILQLAGLSLLIMGLINHFTQNKYVPLVVAIIIVMLSQELSGFRTGLSIVDYFCDLLWGNQFNVYFPLFPWAAFILIGMFFGKWYEEEQKNQAFIFLKMLQIGLVLISSGVLLCLYNFKYNFGDYYHLGPGGTLGLMGLNLIFLFTAYYLVKTVKPNVLFHFIYYCSKHVTTLYIIQWTLINWGMYVFGFRVHQGLGVIAITMGIFLFTLFINYIIIIIIHQKKIPNVAISN